MHQANEITTPRETSTSFSDQWQCTYFQQIRGYVIGRIIGGQTARTFIGCFLGEGARGLFLDVVDTANQYGSTEYR